MKEHKFYIVLYSDNKSSLETIGFNTMKEALAFFNTYVVFYELPFTLTVVEEIKHAKGVEIITHYINL